MKLKFNERKPLSQKLDKPIERIALCPKCWEAAIRLYHAPKKEFSVLETKCSGCGKQFRIVEEE